MSPDLVLDPVLREELKRNGFAFTPLLNAEDVAELLALYREISPEMSSGFYTTLWSDNLDYRQKVHEAISRVLDRRLPSLLGPAKYVLTQFAVKQGGRIGTECPLHQDWSMCDESRHPCVSLWCPLVDVDMTNGPLAVVPGSHRIASRVRPNMPHDFYYSPMSPLYETFTRNYLRDLTMGAGDALLYDGAMTHGSRPNQSLVDRVVVVAALVPDDTQLLHYWMPSRTRVDVFAVDDDFYRSRVALGAKPSDAPLVDVLMLPSEEPTLTEQHFLDRTGDVVRKPDLSDRGLLGPAA